MGHELRPRTGSMPSATAVARLLSTEFPFVKCDEADGMRRAQARADWIEQRPASLFLGRHEHALQHAAMLRRLAPGEALTIEFGDSESRTMPITVLPGELIQFGYASSEDEEASKDLVERCARALTCDVILF